MHCDITISSAPQYEGVYEMPSIQYKMVRTLFKSVGVNKMLAKEGEDFRKLLEKYDKEQKKPLKIPYKKLEGEFEIDSRYINGTRCYTVKVRDSKPRMAVLYLFGGGYILPPDPGDIVLCSEIAENCNAEVWFPLYPMAPSHRLVQTLESSLGVYREILKSFDPEDIRFFGTSSGGGQAMSLCSFIKHEHNDTPLPGRLVLQSPGLQVPPSDKQKAVMESLKDRDVMIPPRFFDNIAPVLATGDEAYLLSPVLDDLTGFPPIDIFYGTEEVMIAYLEDMKDACSRYGGPLNVHIGEGMMHCWGAMSFVPEAQAVRREYFAALSEESHADGITVSRSTGTGGDKCDFYIRVAEDEAKPEARIWDRFAPIYETAMKKDGRIYKWMCGRIREVIGGKDVLELACGPGIISKKVAEAADSMIATDFSNKMIAQAKKGKNPVNLTYEWADATDLRYGDESFDVVIIGNALHVVPEPEKVLSEIRRVLRPDGILIAPTFIHKGDDKAAAVTSRLLELAGIEFGSKWSEEDFAAVLEESGFNITYTKILKASINEMYVECIRK